MAAMTRKGVWRLVAAAALIASVGGCRDTTRPRQPEVVVYVALDRAFAEPILGAFERATGIRVRALYDTESTKTVGLVNRIEAEADRPRCDVFWNNEILNTLRLKHAGLLEPCDPPHAADYPPAYRDAARMWYGFAARARVLIANTQQVTPDQMPRSIRDLADPRWRGRAGIAKPLFGTTATHVACLFARLGPPAAKQLLDAMKRNEVRVLGGNKACAEQVGAGLLAIALTDTDDALIELDAGKPVRILFPDSGPDEMGTLLLPNTLAVVRGAPHPDTARRLIDYLLSPAVEARLARGPSGQIPLNPRTQARSRLVLPQPFRTMEVDYERAARLFPVAARYMETTFLD